MLIASCPFLFCHTLCICWSVYVNKRRHFWASPEWERINYNINLQKKEKKRTSAVLIAPLSAQPRGGSFVAFAAARLGSARLGSARRWWVIRYRGGDVSSDSWVLPLIDAAAPRWFHKHEIFWCHLFTTRDRGDVSSILVCQRQRQQPWWAAACEGSCCLCVCVFLRCVCETVRSQLDQTFPVPAAAATANSN